MNIGFKDTQTTVVRGFIDFVTKQKLRQSLLTRRQSRPHKTSEQRQLLAAGRSLWPLWPRARPLARYWCRGGEPDPDLLLTGRYRHSGRRDHRQCAPWMSWAGSDRIRFRCCSPRVFWRWKRNRYGIVEPFTGRIVRPASLGAVLVPLVGFDALGNRLGRGKGHYDRALAGLAPKPLLIGLAWSEQQVESVPTEPHDQRLDAVVTPERIFLCTARARRRMMLGADRTQVATDRIRSYLPPGKKWARQAFSGFSGKALTRY